MVAYLSEIFRQKLPDASWDLANLATDPEIWEPYIVNKKQSITLFLVTRRFTKGFQRHVRLEFVSTELSK